MCKEKICVGLVKDNNCHNHTDCDNGMYCRAQKEWPYATFCTNLNGEFDICENEYECQIDQMCWYSDNQYSKHKVKTCMPMYS